MTTFASIPVRANGDNVDYNFFNIIRLAGISLENSTVIVHVEASTSPTVNDDITNYLVGTFWYTSDTTQAWLLVDNTDGAAVWREIIMVPTTDKIKDLATDAIEIGDIWAYALKHNSSGTPDLNISVAGNSGNINLVPHGSGFVSVGAGFGIKLNGSSSGSIKISPPAAAGAQIYTLPGADGTPTQYLKTNGSGVLSWGTVAAGSAAGGGITTVTAKTSAYLIDASEATGTVIFNNASASAAVVFTLPSASAALNVPVLSVVGGKRVSIAASSGDTINGYNFTAVSQIYNEKFGARANLVAIDADRWFIENLHDWVDEAVRGVFAGGYISANSDIIDYIAIANTGNASDFGNLTAARCYAACLSGLTRACIGCGATPTVSLVIDYVTVATTGNATSFGNATEAREAPGGLSDKTRGLYGGGFISAARATIDYITIASTGNATAFGNLNVARELLGAVCSPTRGAWAGGTSPNNDIDYVTIASTGNAADFGNLTVARYGCAGVCSDTRGCFGGEYASGTTIDYITIASAGNATDFGDLSVGRGDVGGCSSNIRGCFGGGYGNVDTIDYITIASTGNAADFGNLSVGRNQLSGSSNGHGGLQ